MELTTRCYSEEERQIIIEGIKRVAKGVAISAGVPADRMPIVTVLDDESTPATYQRSRPLCQVAEDIRGQTRR